MPRGHQPRATGLAQSSLAGVAIPDKLYFRIREVSDLTATKPYVLRYWETEFPSLAPVKSSSGHRLYRRQDVETIFEIKRLLYEKGFTIEGARKQLAGNSGGRLESQPESPAHPRPRNGSALNGQQLRAVKRELQAILTILSRKC